MEAYVHPALGTRETIRFDLRRQKVEREAETYKRASGTITSLQSGDFTFQLSDVYMEIFSLNLVASGVVVSAIGEREVKKMWVRKMVPADYAWLGVTTLISLVGLSDLLRYASVRATFLHPLNDLLLIFGSVALSMTVVMVVMDR